MALENLISIAFSKEETDKINKSIEDINDVLANKVINLTPDERKQYGRINNRTEAWIDKINTYMEQNPKLVPFYLDKNEFDKDREARKEFLDILKKINSLQEGMEDTGMLLSTDIYHAALAFYHNVRIASNQNVAGVTTIYKDLAERFPGRPSSTTEEQEINTKQEPTGE
jgi:hypothetical protein